jgi:hypothetical protein
MLIARNSIALKTIAVVFVAFYAVSAVRSLVPGLCATLASLDIASAVISTPDECCDSLPSKENTVRVTNAEKELSTCALCNLTETTANPVAVVTHPKMYASFLDESFDYTFINDHYSHWESISHRGPPVLA